MADTSNPLLNTLFITDPAYFPATTWGFTIQHVQLFKIAVVFKFDLSPKKKSNSLDADC